MIFDGLFYLGSPRGRQCWAAWTSRLKFFLSPDTTALSTLWTYLGRRCKAPIRGRPKGLWWFLCSSPCCTLFLFPFISFRRSLLSARPLRASRCSLSSSIWDLLMVHMLLPLRSLLGWWGGVTYGSGLRVQLDFVSSCLIPFTSYYGYVGPLRLDHRLDIDLHMCH